MEIRQIKKEIDIRPASYLDENAENTEKYYLSLKCTKICCSTTSDHRTWHLLSSDLFRITFWRNLIRWNMKRYFWPYTRKKWKNQQLVASWYRQAWTRLGGQLYEQYCQHVVTALFNCNNLEQHGWQLVHSWPNNIVHACRYQLATTWSFLAVYVVLVVRRQRCGYSQYIVFWNGTWCVDFCGNREILLFSTCSHCVIITQKTKNKRTMRRCTGWVKKTDTFVIQISRGSQGINFFYSPCITSYLQYLYMSNY
jgi:hypothetical protein